MPHSKRRVKHLSEPMFDCTKVRHRARYVFYSTDSMSHQTCSVKYLSDLMPMFWKLRRRVRYIFYGADSMSHQSTPAKYVSNSMSELEIPISCINASMRQRVHASTGHRINTSTHQRVNASSYKERVSLVTLGAEQAKRCLRFATLRRAQTDTNKLETLKRSHFFDSICGSQIVAKEFPKLS